MLGAALLFLLVLGYLGWIVFQLVSVWWPNQEWYDRVQRYAPWGSRVVRRR